MKDKGGRPRKITALAGTTFCDEIMQELKESFKNGMNNTEACLNTNISERIFYNVLEQNEKLKDYFKLLRENINMIAKQNIVNKIKGSKDIELSKWWSERKNKKEFSTRQELTGEDGEDLKVVAEFNYIKPNDKDNTNNRTTTKARQGVEQAT